MAIVTLNAAFENMHGRLGSAVLRRTANGKTSLIKLADMSNVVWSEAQQSQRQRFKEANAYAKAAMADEQARHYYEQAAKRLGKHPYRLALSEYFQGIDRLAEKKT